MWKLKARVLSLAVAVWGIAFMLFPMCVYAGDASNPKISIISPNSTNGYEDICDSINEAIHNEKIWVGDGVEGVIDFLTCDISDGDVVITVNMHDYTNLSEEKRQVVMDCALRGITSSTNNVARTSKTKIYNELCALDSTTSNLVRQLSSDVNADFVGAYNTFKPFSGVVGWIFGLITLGMFLVLGLTIVVDIAYINLPFIQNALTSDQGKPRFVSLEAWDAVKEADSKAGERYVNPTTLYLKHKTKQYIIVCICILYLASGEIYNLISIMISYFRGLL